MEIKHLRFGIDAYRRLIHAAAAPYGPPHEYMNIDLPLTPLRYEMKIGHPVPRVSALRHCLHMLKIVEDNIPAIERLSDEKRKRLVDLAFHNIVQVSAICWSYGLDAPETATARDISSVSLSDDQSGNYCSADNPVRH